MTIRAAPLAVLTCGLAGCVATIQTLPGPPAVAIERADGANIRLTTRQGDTLRLVHARLVTDSVVGTPSPGSRGRVAIPLADVESVALVEPDPMPTAVIVGSAVIVALLALYAAVLIGIRE
jgi:hypothetical protein